MTKRIRQIRNQLQKLGSKKRAEVSQRFFKTAPGEYGEGDVFLGVKVPELRKLAKEDEENLIHKSVGWMLREVGKRNPSLQEEFLKEHYKNMPRTMLRYAIEKLPESKRQRYLKGKI